MRLGNLILEGDLAVIEAIKEKKKLQTNNLSTEHLKILCICGGGLMKGAYSVGVGLAFEEQGYTDVFDDCVGISSGAASLAYFLGGNVNQGGSLIYEECCSKKFFNFRNLFSPINLGFLREVLRGKTVKPLVLSKIFKSKTRLHIMVTDFVTAKPVSLVPDDSKMLIDSILASSWMPHLTKEIQRVRGKVFMDGGFSSPHALQEALETIPYTHVLILMSQNKEDDTLDWLEKFFCQTLFRKRFSRLGLRATLERKESMNEAVERLRSNSSAPWLLVWGDGSIKGTEKDSKKVKTAVETSKQAWTKILIP